MITLKTNFLKYKDGNGNMQDSGMLFAKNETDTTLTESGVAADAKVVGEELNNLSEEIVNYLPKNQGAGNVGKILMVGTDGNLTLAPMPESTSGDVVGVLDESNNIVLTGDLADGTYTLKYEYDDRTETVGTITIDAIVTYTVTQNLTSVTSNNSTTEVVKGASFTATLTPTSGYNMSTVTVKMGGTDITSTAYSNGKVTISNVTGNIVITAVATQPVAPSYTNLADTTSADWKEGYRLDGSGNLKQDSSISKLATTNFIACKNGDVIRIKGLTLGGTGQRVAVYTSNKGNYSAVVPSFPHSDSVISAEVESTGVYKFTLKYANTAYIRFSGVLTGTSGDVIITKNESI